LKLINNFVFSPDGSVWQPSKTSVICSVHFVGGKKSNHPLNPAYIPSLFPFARIKRKNPEQGLQRFDRVKKRRSEDASMTATQHGSTHEEVVNEINDIQVNNSDSVLEPVTRDQTTQISLNYKLSAFDFSCSFEPGNNVSTFANISSFHNLKTANKSCGPETAQLDGFYGYSSIKNSKKFSTLTGVSKEVFQLFLNMLPNVTHIKKVSKENRLLIFLIKMKSGMSFSEISEFFMLDISTVSRIFYATLNILSLKTKNFIYWPSRKAIKATLPETFKSDYSNCRVIIDCTEVKTETPNDNEKCIYMYSSYKSAYTIKFLVGIAPSGLITFVSSCYGGRASDSFITNDCGILKLIEPGDLVLADKGFPGIKTSLSEKNCILVVPPFLHEGHLTKDEVGETYKIASLRIHVERSIQRIKIYEILNKLQAELLPKVDEIVHMCCVMVNLQNPIIKKK